MMTPRTRTVDGMEVGRCRSCGAVVLWSTMESGKRNPLDLPVLSLVTGEGRVYDRRLVVPALPAEGGWLRCRVVPGRPLGASEATVPPGEVVQGRTSHFATCPSAQEHRRPKPKKAAPAEAPSLFPEHGGES